MVKGKIKLSCSTQIFNFGYLFNQQKDVQRMFIQMLGSFKFLSTLLIQMYLCEYSCIHLVGIIVGAL